MTFAAFLHLQDASSQCGVSASMCVCISVCLCGSYHLGTAEAGAMRLNCCNRNLPPRFTCLLSFSLSHQSHLQLRWRYQLWKKLKTFKCDKKLPYILRRSFIEKLLRAIELITYEDVHGQVTNPSPFACQANTLSRKCLHQYAENPLSPVITQWLSQCEPRALVADRENEDIIWHIYYLLITYKTGWSDGWKAKAQIAPVHLAPVPYSLSTCGFCWMGS